MLWTPKHHHISDVTIVWADGRYHLFGEARSVDADMVNNPWPKVVCHAVSDDMFEWEELPIALECGPEGAFDAFSIYHMDVLVHEGRWYMFYTGLDRGGPGEQQSVGLATSEDGITWEKHEHNPVLRADPRWYEPAIPREATYAEKDFGRLWFRDPMIVRDPATGGWGMTVIARDLAQPPDGRGCLAWATSNDLLHWEAHPPIYSPGRFHTIETPSIIEHDGRWYAMFMAHPGWGGSVMTTDPYQNAGDFYAISDTGPAGPYRTPPDEVVVAAPGSPRMGATRVFKGVDGSHYLYGWLQVLPAKDDDAPSHRYRQYVPPPRRVNFDEQGYMRVCYHEGVERFFDPPCLPAGELEPHGEQAWALGAVTSAKDYFGRALATYPQPIGDAIVSTRIDFIRGERAGLVLRCDEQLGTGWYVVADRQHRRIEFGLLDRPIMIDARGWQPTDSLEIKVVMYQESIEVYADEKLMIHQVRHREKSGRVGLLIERAHVEFLETKIRSIR